jgi:polysaccharide chain length determinant protein (PEP-CTERM system associated)
MLPGKKYQVDDFLRMAWNRKWIILVPTVLVSVATFTWAHYLPNRYRSSSTILVIPQRVPESFVRSTVTADVTERLTSISQQILSRTRLERLIEEFKLYDEARKNLTMEDIVERMRADINVQIIQPRRRNQEASSFTVSYQYSQPRTAMLVTERLASMFVQENLQDREVLADSTDQFLQTQLEEVRRRLLEHEQKLEQFRRANEGRLPTQVQSNLQMLQSIQARIQSNNDTANRDRERLQSIETALGEAAAAPPTYAPLQPARSSETNGRGEVQPQTLAQQLAAARAALQALELRLKPEHPDVVRAKRVLGELEVKAEAEALAVSVSPDAAPVAVTAQDKAAATRLGQLRIEADEIRSRMEARKKDDARLQQMLLSYTSRVEAAPGLQSAETQLMRDYATIQEKYTGLLKKSEDSKLAVSLERRQIGEQFKVVDGARLPERPISPDRTRLNLMGLFGGLGLGLAIVALLEYRDTTVKTDDDVLVSLGLPVLAVIPVMVTTIERRRARRRRMSLLLSTAASAMIVAVVVAWRLQLFRAWIR